MTSGECFENNGIKGNIIVGKDFSKDIKLPA
jgi:hypothetical protein